MNPLKFVELDAPTVARYESKHIDREWFRLVQKKWERKVNYDQPWRMDDKICVHIHCNGAPTISLLSDDGVQVGSVGGFPDTTTLPGNIVDGVTLDTHQIHTTPTDYNPTPGRHYFLLTVVEGASTRQFISEPLMFKESWPNTLLVECRHPRNEYDVAFALNPKFCHRVEADLRDLRTEFADTSFEDQGHDQTLIHSERWRTWTLRIGTKKGIPEWVADRIAEGLRCSNVWVDGKRFVRPDGETFDMAPRTPTPLLTATISLREQRKYENITWGSGTVVLFSVPSYPFFIGTTQLGGGGMGTTYISDPVVIEDPTGLADWLVVINALLLEGSFSVVAGQVVYVNGQAESFNTVYTSIYSKVLEVDVEVNSTGHFARYRYMGVSGHGTDWGNGTVTEQGPAITTPVATSALYTTTGTKTFRLFHDDGLSLLRWNDPGIALAVMTAFSGDVPTQLYEWRATGPGLSTGHSFDLDLLLPCRNALGVFVMNGMGLSTITGSPFAAASAIDPLSVFPGLAYIDVNNNFLNQANLEPWILDFINMGTGLSNGGTLDIAGQTPAAPPTGTFSADLLGLTGFGWAVFTD